MCDKTRHDTGGETRPEHKSKTKTSGKLFSRIIPWHVGLAIIEPIIRLFDPPRRLVEPYFKNGQVVTDLGCGRGYYTLALAELVSPEGKVYAVDFDKRCIRALEKKADKAGYYNIEAHTSSAAYLSFIKDKSIDFIFANGLLCSMASDRRLSINEMKRILKPDGQAYLSLGFHPPLGFVDKEEWERILELFQVEKGGSHKGKWAVVSMKSEPSN